MSIADKIQRLQAAKTAIATAITNKGGTVASGDGYEDFATDIATIPSGGGTDNLPAFISDGISTFTNNNITKISAFAFYYRSSSYVTTPITSVSCANVETIGNEAFRSCSQLVSADFPKCKTIGSSTFASCSGLTGFATTDNLTSIGNNAFSGCTNLTSFTIPQNVTSIGNNAFQNCTYITTFNYNAKNVTNFANNSNGVFYYLGQNTSGVTFSIGDTVEHIPSYFFYSNSSASYLPKITTVNFPVNNNISSIGTNAFYQCKGISGSISFPNITTITILMSYAFYGCLNLTSLSLQNLSTASVTNGLYYLCSGCTSLTSVDLSSLAEIKRSYVLRYAFRNCTSLTSLSFPALTSTSFGTYTNQFNGMLQGVTGCTVHFPSNLQSIIGSWADVTAGFGGTNTTVLFDLTATT